MDSIYITVWGVSQENGGVLQNLQAELTKAVEKITLALNPCPRVQVILPAEMLEPTEGDSIRVDAAATMFRHGDPPHELRARRGLAFTVGHTVSYAFHGKRRVEVFVSGLGTPLFHAHPQKEGPVVATTTPTALPVSHY